MLTTGLAGLILSFGLPFIGFALLRRLAGLDTLNAGAVAAHYGSVSVVTFVTGIAVLQSHGSQPAGWMVAVLALMETPAIIAGLILARSDLLSLINAGIGLGVAALIGLSGGTAAAFLILCASASYIAVPAAISLALPRADMGLCLAMSLAITFPFNIIVGIPLYGWMAGQL
jgi:hypothetical protein